MIGTFFISNQSTNYEQILIIIPVMGARGSEIDQPPYARFLQPGITPNASSQLPFFFPWDGFNVRARVMDVICASVSRERGGEDPLKPHGQTFFFFLHFLLLFFFDPSAWWWTDRPLCFCRVSAFRFCPDFLNSSRYLPKFCDLRTCHECALLCTPVLCKHVRSIWLV